MVREFNGNLTVTASSIDNSPLFVVDNNNFSIQVIGTVTGDLQLEESLDREGPWAIVKDSKITAEGEFTWWYNWPSYTLFYFIFTVW